MSVKMGPEPGTLWTWAFVGVRSTALLGTQSYCPSLDPPIREPSSLPDSLPGREEAVVAPI